MALVYLFGSPEAELVGIASTAGNTNVATGLQEQPRAARAVPDHRRAGVEGIDDAAEHTAADGRGHPRAAGCWLCPVTHYRSATHRARRRARRGCGPRAPTPVSWSAIATGPLTNLALAVRAEPALPRLLRRLVIMGGAFDYRGNTTPVAEWNVSVDPESAAEVFAAWTGAENPPIVSGAQPDRAHRDDTRTAGPARRSRRLVRHRRCRSSMTRGTASVASNPLIRVLEDAMRFYFEFHHDQGEGLSGASARSAGRRGGAGPRAGALPAGPGGRRTDRHPDPGHDDRRLERSLGPGNQRAHRRRRGSRRRSSTGSSPGSARSRERWADVSRSVHNRSWRHS